MTEVTKIMTHDEFKELIRKFGVRYVIRNYKLPKDFISEILQNKMSCLCEEEDIDINEITSYQNKFNK